jgi:hypothetical protein
MLEELFPLEKGGYRGIFPFVTPKALGPGASKLITQN